MRPLLLPLAFLLACCSASPPDQQPQLEGHWRGTVVEDHRAVAIGLDFARVDGRLAGTMSLPSERLLGKALGGIREEGGTIAFTIPGRDAPLHFTGRIDHGRLSGSVEGGGRSVPLALGRAPAPPPPPHREERLSFASGELRLAGSLLLPPGRGAVPAVILIHGSSTPDRDDFRYFADLYARAGIAAFIYDKRPTGAETDGGTASLEELAGDVIAAADMLARRGDVDPARIGLWGFSQGGWVAPIAASRRRFAFVIACAPPGVSFAEVTLYADAARLRAADFAPAEIQAAVAAQRRLDGFVRAAGDPAPVQAMLDDAHRQRWARFTTLPHRLPGVAERRTYLRWRDLDLDPGIYWRRVRAPVFLAAGGADRNVPPEESLRRIRAALAAGGNRDVAVHLYPGANHSLAPAPALEADLVAWTLAALRRARPA
jgi:dipeptidyl aminopeptidase/acylaminoacyl peptidase